ncbi:hypothetical protein B0A52_02542 [Exophiala mesophila]|uniref:Ubiquinol-cytochrome c chaperone domain-containing protein n=1 Tax=Exophiala mesophila TaxID=212818 RepID=A0A438NCY2_EXOME|nr:hypothetical protein B0A52_02542 [Exophiala mesophila]
MRALRQHARSEAFTLPKSLNIHPRHFSKMTPHSKSPDQPAAPKSQSNKPVIPPSMASTVTTNIAAENPEMSQQQQSEPALNSSSQPNVAAMQKQIMSSLGQKDDLATRLAKGLRKTAKSTTESYITYGVTEAIFNSCAAQADYTIPEDQRMNILTGKGPPKTADDVDLGQPLGTSWWFRTLDLPPTFSTWSQVTFLHMYIMTVRLRNLETPAAFRDYQRYLIEHFSSTAEDKMILLHNMSARGIRNKYLKDLFWQWRGVLAAYDEGLIKGDAVLASAIWRNLFRGDENVDWDKVAKVVAFTRKGIATVANLDIQTIVDQSVAESNWWTKVQQGLPEP